MTLDKSNNSGGSGAIVVMRGDDVLHHFTDPGDYDLELQPGAYRLILIGGGGANGGEAGEMQEHKIEPPWPVKISLHVGAGGGAPDSPDGEATSFSMTSAGGGGGLGLRTRAAVIRGDDT